MKKIIVFTAALFILMGISCHAEYNRDINEYNIDLPQERITTILICRGEDAKEGKDIFFVDQNDSGFGSAMKFFLKKNPPSGKYSVKMCGYDGNLICDEFEIGTKSQNENDTELYYDSYAWKSNGINAVFSNSTIKVSDLNQFNTIKIFGAAEDGKALCYSAKKIYNSLLQYGEDKPVQIQINSIPMQYIKSVSVYLSKE